MNGDRKQMGRPGDDVAELAIATAAIERVETLAPTGLRAGAIESAREALEGLRQRAAREIFPEAIEQADSAVLRDLNFFFLEFRGAPAPGEGRVLELAAAFAALHGRAYPAFAAAIRGPRGRLIITAALLVAARHAALAAAAAARKSVGELESALVRDGLREFERLVAGQLVERHACAPFAEILAERVPELEQRLAAVLEARKVA